MGRSVMVFETMVQVM